MKQRIYFWIFVAVVLLLLFGSCGSSHKSVKSDVEVISKDSASESVNIRTRIKYLFERTHYY